MDVLIGLAFEVVQGHVAQTKQPVVRTWVLYHHHEVPSLQVSVAMGFRDEEFANSRRHTAGISFNARTKDDLHTFHDFTFHWLMPKPSATSLRTPRIWWGVAAPSFPARK